MEVDNKQIIKELRLLILFLIKQIALAMATMETIVLVVYTNVQDVLYALIEIFWWSIPPSSLLNIVSLSCQHKFVVIIMSLECQYYVSRDNLLSNPNIKSTKYY